MKFDIQKYYKNFNSNVLKTNYIVRTSLQTLGKLVKILQR